MLLASAISFALTIPVNATAVVATVHVGGWPSGVAVNPVTNRIYVVNQLDHNVSVIEGATNTVIAVIPVGGAPMDVAVNPATNRIFVTNETDDTVSVIDGVNNTVITSISVDSGPLGVAVNSSTNRIYVANQSSNTVSVIDGLTNDRIATILVGSGPSGVAVNSSTNRIYVGNRDGDSVSVIDGNTNTVVGNIPLATPAILVAVNSSTNRIYVTGLSTNPVTVVDGASDTVLTTVPVGPGPYGVAVNAWDNLIYVANSHGNNLSVIDGVNNSEISIIGIGSLPVLTDVNPDTGFIYVTNFRDGNVWVLTEPTAVGSVTPNQGMQGQRLQVGIAGSNFPRSASLNFGSDITISNVVVVSPTLITATLTIGDNAQLGLRNVSVTTASGTVYAPGAFMVTQAPPPFVATTPPPEGPPHSSSASNGFVTPGPVPLPNILVDNASLSAAMVPPGTPVTVTASVANTGTAAGSAVVRLFVNGQEEVRQGVSVNGGRTSQVGFTISRDEPGTYSVYVGNVPAGSFTVDAFADPNLILYFSAALVVVSLVLGAIYIYRRSYSSN
ncbi:MAG: YncE family protein [Dehalococcoidia bacterium]